MVAVLNALAHLHERHIAHYDIKPCKEIPLFM